MKDKERLVLSQLYANKANSVKFLPFFFRSRKELRCFFNMFGGKTLVLPDTFEEFVESCLKADSLSDDFKQIGIDEQIHERTKDRIVESYIRLFNSLEDVLKNECEEANNNKGEK